MLNRAHKIRLYPTAKQEQQLYQTAGACRYAYNWFVDEGAKAYQDWKDGKIAQYPTAFIMMTRWRRERPAWSYTTAVNSQVQEAMYVAYAVKQHIAGCGNLPKHHKRGYRDSFYCQNTAVHWLKDNRVSIPKVGRVRIAESLRFSGKIMSYIVSREGNDWFISVNMEVSNNPISADAPDSAVGIDVGLSHVATTSDGQTLDLPEKLKKLETRKRHQQQRLSRAQRKQVTRNGKTHRELSKNGQKKLRRLRTIQTKINNIREDATHKFTTAVCKSHATVVVEDLRIDDMTVKAPKPLRRSFARSMMREVLRQFEYKAKHLVKAPRFFASSKTCSQCGTRKEDLKLSDRTYKCEHCGLSIDRDLNAAINLMKTPWVAGKAPAEDVPTNVHRSRKAAVLSL